MTTRRRFLTGLLSAPAVITTPGLLMPVRAWGETAIAGLGTPISLIEYAKGLRDDRVDALIRAYTSSIFEELRFIEVDQRIAHAQTT